MYNTSFTNVVLASVKTIESEHFRIFYVAPGNQIIYKVCVELKSLATFVKNSGDLSNTKIRFVENSKSKWMDKKKRLALQ